MPNIELRVGRDRFAANVDAGRRRGLGGGREHDHGRMERSGRRQLHERAEPTMRQSRRPQCEVVEIEHDQNLAKWIPLSLVVVLNTESASGDDSWAGR